jgi:3-hydroxyacyl-CoA dehydrogenase/enoyl-CoA hydratase/3-hydroxybutyryl-CoA epimerase
VARAYDYVQAIGKMPIVVNDSRGFFTSRVFGTFVMEGAAMLGEGIPAAAIENAGIAVRHAGRPAGRAGRNRTHAEPARHGANPPISRLEGKTYTPSPGEALIVRMVRKHERPGACRWAGFYEYPTEKGAKKFLWPQLKPLFEKADASGTSPT